VDLLGPLKSKGCNKYLLCMTDAFTKVATITPIPDKEAQTVATAIWSKWICRFTVPEQIHSDGGKEFVNKLALELFQLIGTKHSKTTPAHPQCNAQVERFNRTLLDYLRAFQHDDSTEWETIIPALEFYYNASYHSTIETSPFRLLYGFAASLPDLNDPSIQAEEDHFRSHPHRLQELQARRDKAGPISERNKLRQKEAFDKTAEPHKFQIGQQVLYTEMDFVGKNAKIASKWAGPATILELNEHNALLKLPSGKQRLINVHRLKNFIQPPSSSNPEHWKLFNEQGEGLEAFTQQQLNLISNQAKEGNEDCWQAVNLINTAKQLARPYLLELCFKILRSPPEVAEPLTPQERSFYEQFTPWQRSMITTGSPFGIPEYRQGLIAMPGRTRPAPAPMGPPPAAPPLAQPVQMPPPPPRPSSPGPTTKKSTLNRSRTRMRRPPPPPSDRVLRSQSRSNPASSSNSSNSSWTDLTKTETTKTIPEANSGTQDTSLAGRVLQSVGWSLWGRASPPNATDDKTDEQINTIRGPVKEASDDCLSFF